MRANVLIACVISLYIGVGSNAAQASETGFVNMHNLARYGSYLCTVTHEHTGLGKVKRNKRLALRSAIRSWSEFTAWEYGSTWGKWRYARGKSVFCDGNKGQISCSVIARPCKRLR